MLLCCQSLSAQHRSSQSQHIHAETETHDLLCHSLTAGHVFKSLHEYADLADFCVGQEEKAFCLSTNMSTAHALSMCIHQLQVHIWLLLHVGNHSYGWAHPVNTWHRPVYL